MNDNALQITIRNAFYRCTRLMHRKSQEYSPNEDRLENFKESGKEDNISPEEALWGMIRKHLTSLSMMCRAVTERPDCSPQTVWEEKLTDAHNYLFLLEALLKERYGWTGVKLGMDLIAWRTIGKNPCDDPPVTITIAPMGERLVTFRMGLNGLIPRTIPLVPWVFPIEVAIEMFGRDRVNMIGEEPAMVTLNLSLGKGTSSTSIP